MKIDRCKYYSSDKYGNMLFNISRCFNDMAMAKRLVNSINESEFDDNNIKISYTLYISKLYFGHLKEALKLLDIIYNNDDYKNNFCTQNVLKLMDEIKSEINFEDGSLNKKYLNIRHDAFHYKMVDNSAIKTFKQANERLYNNGFKDVTIGFKNNIYQYELACDVLTLTKYFNCDTIPKEIMTLYDKVMKIINLILSEICIKNQNNNE